jgi:uncharacterized protein YndB with AHSA1/START domain
LTPEARASPEAAPVEVTTDGEQATLVFRRVLHHPPARVWSAITEPEQIRTWFVTEAKIDGRRGGSIDLVTGADRVHTTGRILEWEPPRVYEYEWRVPPGGFVPKGENGIVRWELTPAHDGTLLVLTYRRLSRSTAARLARGYSLFLDRLAAQLDGTELPAWPPAARRPPSVEG